MAAIGGAAARQRQSTGAGELRHRVTFAERDSTSDEYGNPSTGWRDRCTVAADITPRLGGETVMAARLAGSQVVMIRVRKTPLTARVTTDWRATDAAGAQYNIRSAIDPNMGNGQYGQWLEMLAETGVAV